MPKSIYLVFPKTAGHTGMSSCGFLEKQGHTDIVAETNLALLTVAAMAPEDFDVAVCDENLEPIDFGTKADIVGITGYVLMLGDVIAVAKKFRELGKLVIIGGQIGSIDPKWVRPYCDILVRGELEEIAPQLFSDLRDSCWKEEYRGTFPDPIISPLPRWDLIRGRVFIATVQTSRGCPYSCEFCYLVLNDVRKQRFKPVSRVLEELDLIYRHGFRFVCFADDNLTTPRNRARELLKAIRDWNSRRENGPVFFGSMMSIDAAQDTELLTLCVEAGLVMVCVGLESPNVESLKSVKKYHNTEIDQAAQLQRLVHYGILPMCSMIVGLDFDGPDIFNRHYDLAAGSPVPNFCPKPLFAIPDTPLYGKLEEENRLYGFEVIPKQMSWQQLKDGLTWLRNVLYEPTAFGERMLRFIDQYGACRNMPFDRTDWETSLEEAGMSFIFEAVRRFLLSGTEEAEMWKKIERALSLKPQATPAVSLSLLLYAQYRNKIEIENGLHPELIKHKAPVSCIAGRERFSYCKILDASASGRSTEAKDAPYEFQLIDSSFAEKYFHLTFPSYRKLLAEASVGGAVSAVGLSILGTPVALALAEVLDDRSARLLSIFVSSGYRKRGIATALLGRLEAELIRNGCPWIGTEFLPDKPYSGVLRRLTAKAGWQRSGMTFRVQGR